MVSGNGGTGVWITGNATSGNLVLGNKVGTNVEGTAAIGNGYWGVALQDSPANTVGGTTAGAGNVVSGNDEGGVAILFAGSVGDVVQGNLIGTNATGAAALGNGYSGVYVGDWGVTGDAATDATIGGTAAGAGNVISANGNWGVWISDAGTTGVVVEGNKIGTNLAGTAALGNAYDGVHLDGGASGNTIGGAAAGAGNLISGNKEDGIDFSEAGQNVVQGNFIGTNATGTAALGNRIDGVHLHTGSNGNLIGGAAGNVISGNLDNGVEISDSSGNIVEANFIGTNAAGSAVLGNKVDGVLIKGGASDNKIGGARPVTVMRFRTTGTTASR